MTEIKKESWNKRKVKPVYSLIALFVISPLVGATLGFLDRSWQPFIFSLVWDVALFLPLLVIAFTYCLIMGKIFHRGRGKKSLSLFL